MTTDMKPYNAEMIGARYTGLFGGGANAVKPSSQMPSLMRQQATTMPSPPRGVGVHECHIAP
eukprot:4906900-Amphidinium_carterae.1